MWFSSSRRSSVVGGLMAGASLCAAFSDQARAQAQTAALPPLTVLREVLVTATRTEQALQTAPVSAVVILGEQIIAAGLLDANQAVRQLGGVAFRADLAGGREAALDVRGFGDSAANNLVVLIDGVRLSENELLSARLSEIPPERIERIEILRGGSGVLWGEGATAGVIQIVTRQIPGGQVSGSAQLSLESDATRDARVLLNLPGEAWAVSLQARDFETEGFRRNSAQRNAAVGLSGQSMPGQPLTLRWELFTQALRARLPGALPFQRYLLDPRDTATPLDDASRDESRASLNLRYSAGAWVGTADVAARARRAASLSDYGAGGNQTTRTRSDGLQLSPRLQYTGALGDAAVTVLGGLDLLQWDYRNDIAFSGIPSNAEAGSQSNRAVYVQLDAVLPSDTRVVAGLRREAIDKRLVDTMAARNVQQDLSLKAWELGLNHTLATGLDAYLRWAGSFRVANVDESRFLTTPLRPQTGRDVQLGMRWRTGAGTLGARWFLARTQDEIAYDNNTFSNVNLDPLRRRGFELDATLALDRAWSLAATLQTLQARFASGVYAGKRPPHVSEVNAMARLAYAPDARWRAELSLRHRGEAVVGNDLNNTCTQRVPSLTTADVSLRFAPSGEKGWSLLAGVDNLGDRRSFSWAFTNSTCSALNVYPDAGRTLRVNARYAF